MIQNEMVKLKLNHMFQSHNKMSTKENCRNTHAQSQSANFN